MEKVLSLFAEIKSWFAGTDDKLSKIISAETRVKALEADLTERDQRIAALTADLEKAQAEVSTKGSEIKALQEKLTAAENKAMEVLAGQGIDPNKIPATEPDATNQPVHKQVEALRARLSASADPKEKFTLSKQIKELLSKKN